MKKLVLVMSLLSAPALACNQGDLAGRWNLMFADMSCEMTVQTNGKVSKGNCLHLPEDPSNTGARSAVRGRLNVLSSCRVTGSLRSENRQGDELLLKIGQSRIGKSLEFWHGIVWIGKNNSTTIPGFGVSDEFTGDYANFSAVYLSGN